MKGRLPSLTNTPVLALKAAFATAVAIVISVVAGNPDFISATFVAVLCCSPTILLGIRQGGEQLLGGLAGAGLGAFLYALEVSPLYGVPLAVGASILVLAALGRTESYHIASFSALYVQFNPFEHDAGLTLGIRALSIGIGLVSGMAANVLLSAVFYRKIFSRRLALTKTYIEKIWPQVLRDGPAVVESGFSLFADLKSQFAVAKTELKLRRQIEAEWIEKLTGEIELLQYTLHLIYGLALAEKAGGLSSGEVKESLDIINNGDEKALTHFLAKRKIETGPSLLALHSSIKKIRERKLLNI